MTKSELIAKVANELNSTNSEAQKAFEATLSVIGSSLLEGNQITLTGIGTLSVVHRGARQGRNPRTGEAIAIPAGKTVKLSPSRALKDALNPS